MARGRPHGRSKSDHRVCQAARHARAAEYRERIAISAEQQEARIAAVNAECNLEDAPHRRRGQKSKDPKTKTSAARVSAQGHSSKATGSGKKKADKGLEHAHGKAAQRDPHSLHCHSCGATAEFGLRGSKEGGNVKYSCRVHATYSGCFRVDRDLAAWAEERELRRLKAEVRRLEDELRELGGAPFNGGLTPNWNECQVAALWVSTPMSSSLISTLLMIGGVETNPGPTIEEVAKASESWLEANRKEDSTEHGVGWASWIAQPDKVFNRILDSVKWLDNTVTYTAVRKSSALCGWPKKVGIEERAADRTEEGTTAREERATGELASGGGEQPSGVYKNPETRREAAAIFKRLKGQLQQPDAVERELLKMSDDGVLECFSDSEEEALRKLKLLEPVEGASKTPPNKDFSRWLADHRPSEPLSFEQAWAFLQEVPLSLVNKEFLKSNLRAVPELREGELTCPIELATVFPRPDFVEKFEELYDQEVNICVAQGLRRLGKSVSILEAVLSVRAKKRGMRDKVVFFWDGTGNRPSNFKTIFSVLNCMGLVALIDEFQNYPEVAGDLKGFVEGAKLGRPGSTRPETPIQFVFYGSIQEKIVHQKEKVLNAIHGAGTKVAAVTLPPASIGLLRSIMRRNVQAPPLDIGSPGRPQPENVVPRSEAAGTSRELSWGEEQASEGEQASPALEVREAFPLPRDGNVEETLADVVSRVITGEVTPDEEGGASLGARAPKGAEGALKESAEEPSSLQEEVEELRGRKGDMGEGALGELFGEDEEMTLLRRVTLGGFDLKLHHREMIPTVEEFAQLSMSELVYAAGTNEAVLRRLVDVSKDMQNVDQAVVGALCDAGLIKATPTGGKYECVEPRLLALSILRKFKSDANKLAAELPNVEGKVFEKLLQSDPDMTGALFKLLDIQKDSGGFEDTYGTFSKDGKAEIDRLLYEPSKRKLTLVSAKRDRKQQDLRKSFLDHVEKLCGSMTPFLEKFLPQVQTLRLVAISARARGSPFSLLPHHIKSTKLQFDERSGKFRIGVCLKKESGSKIEEKKKAVEGAESGGLPLIGAAEVGKQDKKKDAPKCRESRESELPLDVDIGKQESKKKAPGSDDTGLNLTWEVEARDLTFADLLNSISTQYPPCVPILVE